MPRTAFNGKSALGRAAHSGLGVLVAALSVFATVPASAQTTTSVLYGIAGIGDLSISVVDLDLTDGVDASFEFLLNSDGMSGYAHTNMEVTSGGTWTQQAPNIVTNGFMQFPAFQGEVAGVTGSVVPVDDGVIVAAAAAGEGTSFLVSAGTQTLFYEYMSHALWMAPHTQLDITLDAFTFAAVSGMCAVDSAQCGYVQATAFLQGSTITSTDTPFDTLVSEANYGDSRLSFSTGSLTISLSNFAAEPDRAYLFANAVVQGVTPVPEPSTYMLMLAGLLGVGWITRRRVSN